MPDSVTPTRASTETDTRPAERSRVRMTNDLFNRTWELELLISGAVVFALLQLPGLLDRTFVRLDPHLDGTLRALLVLGTFLGRMVLYALICSFLVHLAARAYWVGLIGLNTVFPHGVRWDQARYGPVTKQMYRERQPSLPALIANVDRFCSVIFSFSFTIVFSFVGGVVVGGVLLSIALAIGGARFEPYFFALLMLVLLPSLVQWIDRRFGERLQEGGRARRAIRAVNLASHYGMLMFIYQPVLNIFLSNFRRTRFYGVFFGVTLVMMGFFVAVEEVRRGDIRLGGYLFVPDAPEEHGLDFRHYEDRRPAGEVFAFSPSIQSEVVEEPFVRLFIPYIPRRHNEALAERCPGVRPAGGAGIRRVDGETADPALVARILGCLAAIHTVTLNGERVAEPRFRFSTDPESGLRGIVAHLPTMGLPAGENHLVVAPIPLSRAAEQRGAATPRPHHIPFWIAR
jgi:hypothetical protein